MSKTDISEKGLEDLIVEHLVGVNGFEQGTSADYLAAVVVRLKSAESAKYFACLFRSNYWRDQLRRACNGVKVYSITRGRLSGMGVLLPRLPEQREIVAYLDGATAKIDAAVAAIEKGIGLLKERRARLVSDAVTGRIDLRKEVA